MNTESLVHGFSRLECFCAHFPARWSAPSGVLVSACPGGKNHRRSNGEVPKQREFIGGSCTVAGEGPRGTSFVMHIKRDLQSKQTYTVCH